MTISIDLQIKLHKARGKNSSKCSARNNLVEFAPEFAVDLIDLIE
jgi:hypothetical protein